MNKVLAEMHSRHYARLSQMMHDSHHSPERKKLIQEEMDRHEEMYLKYSEGENHPGIDKSGEKAITNEPGKGN
jgi:hypothetical protein